VSQLGTGKMPVAPKERLHNRKFAGSSIPTRYSISNAGTPVAPGGPFIND
jgi:hypothetical protein